MRRFSNWSSLSMSVPLSSVSITTRSIGRQCFSKLLGEKSTDDPCPSLVRVPLDGLDGLDKLFGDLVVLISSSCLNCITPRVTHQSNVKHILSFDRIKVLHNLPCCLYDPIGRESVLLWRPLLGYQDSYSSAKSIRRRWLD